MQHAQIGGGFIAPALAAHLEKNAQQVTKTQGQPVPAATTLGGGIISPQLERHMSQKQMGGGAIHPLVARHIRACDD